MMMFARLPRSASPTLPGTSSMWSTSSLSPPNWLSSLMIVFGPTPGVFGRLSEESPRTAA